MIKFRKVKLGLIDGLPCLVDDETGDPLSGQCEISIDSSIVSKIEVTIRFRLDRK